MIPTVWKEITPKEFSATRKLCLVAEAVYTAFFRAFYYKAYEDLKGLSP